MVTATHPRTATRTAARPGYRYRDHIVVGTAQELANVVELHRTAGSFVALGKPVPVTGGKFQVPLRLVERVPVPARPVKARPSAATLRRRRQVRKVVIVTAVATGGLIGVGYLLSVAVSAIAAHLPLLLGAVFVLLLIAAGLRRSTGACMGLHCPGCGHR